MKEITPALLHEWANVLRSGQYTQGQRRLKIRDHTGYHLHCCLGVLGELLECEWEGPLRLDANPDIEYYTADGLAVLLSGINEKLRLYLGLSQGDFIRMNDADGKTFSEIADAIVEGLAFTKALALQTTAARDDADEERAAEWLRRL